MDMTDQPGGATNPRTIRLRGIVTSGTGEAGLITEIPWVKKQFIDKLGIDPYPGTFNLAVLLEDREKLSTIRAAKGIEIPPQDENYCAATSFPVSVSSRIKGAVIIPLVPNYPPAQLEIIAAQNIKRSLAVRDGDQIEVEVYL